MSGALMRDIGNLIRQIPDPVAKTYIVGKWDIIKELGDEAGRKIIDLICKEDFEALGDLFG